MKTLKQTSSFLLVAIIIMISFTSCTKDYFISPNFSSKTSDHSLVAVLPVEMIVEGQPLGQMEPDDLIAIEEAESRAFQISLFNELLQSSQSGKKPLRVDFMSVDKTNEILEAKEIGIRESWEMSPEKLAKILKVDAVVKARVTKQRYLTDLASYGIDMGRKLLGVFTKGKSIFALPGDVDKTSDIRAICNLVNADDGVVLWSMSSQSETDWNDPDAEVIDRVNYRLAKNFPYRGKRR